jgi:hydroxylamine reductase
MEINDFIQYFKLFFYTQKLFLLFGIFYLILAFDILRLFCLFIILGGFMFCYQCQEATGGIGCSSKAGYCGKSSDTANLQDLLVHACKGIAFYNNIAAKNSINLNKVDKFIIDSLFSTITNVNFDPKFFIDRIQKAIQIREEVKLKLIANKIEFQNAPDSATFKCDNEAEIIELADKVGVKQEANEDIRSLKELAMYGLKGTAAYAKHALNLHRSEQGIFDFVSEALTVCDKKDSSVDELFNLVLKTGEIGVQAMAMLDTAHNDTYGAPEITKVSIGVKDKPGILISGHDLKDMEQLLEQCENSGVDVYTHSEMLPAHYYPAFKKFSCLAGNYGGSWWRQTEEFESFNGPILFTTNCLVPPKKTATYADKVYTTGVVGYPGFKEIQEDENGKKDFGAIIEHAKQCKAPVSIETGEIVGGFAHSQTLALADKIVDAVKSGAIRKFVVMAGCDGRMKSREYYTEFAQKLPKDCVILTAGCAKYRYNKLPLGDIGGIPRMIDAGQCNDSYSLALIALKLKEVFGLDDINKLPIVYNIAWYEQKAVIVLLALLYLGVKNIHLGPTLPAFLSPNVINVLVEKFNIGGIGNVDDDLKLFLRA